MPGSLYSKKVKKIRFTLRGEGSTRLPSTEISLRHLARSNTKVLVYVGTGILIVSVLGYVFVRTQASPVLYFSLAWVALISFLLWIGNRFLTKRLDKLMSWSRWGNVRFFTQLM